jgi:hypothetical protein
MGKMAGSENKKGMSYSIRLWFSSFKPVVRFKSFDELGGNK